MSSGEDCYFYLNVALKAESFYITDKPYYHYSVNQMSATHYYDESNFVKKIIDAYLFNLRMYELLLSNSKVEYTNYVFDRVIWTTKVLLGKIALHCDYKKYLKYIEEIEEQSCYKKMKEYQAEYRNYDFIRMKSKKFYYKIKIKSKIKYVATNFISNICGKKKENEKK